MDPHSSSAGYSQRYHAYLDLTSQKWDDLHDTPVFPFTEPQSTDFISSSELANPSTSTEVSTSNAKGKSDVWKYFRKKLLIELGRLYVSFV